MTRANEFDASIAEANSKIRALYDAGTPFFTKETLRDVCQQLKKAKKGQKVMVKGLDGVTVDFEIQVGYTRPAPEPEAEYIYRAPHISYRTVQRLTSSSGIITPRYAYCNLPIYHYQGIRNKVTKEPIDITPTPTLQAHEESFKTSLRAWEVSEACKQLRSRLVPFRSSLEINKIIGFACGTFSNGFRQQSTQRSLFQHALTLTIRDVLGKTKANPDGPICYAQDPAYTDVDKLVLGRSNITVLDDPEGFLEVDSSTAVFSCAPNVPVRQIISDLALPAIMIWDKVKDDAKDSDEMKTFTTDPDSPRLKEMIKKYYDKIEFPNDAEHFGDHLAIYVRRTATEPER